MSGIQSAIGVITGIPIADTVDKLIAIAAKPRDNLSTRNATLKQQQVAITEITALVIGVQLATDKFDDEDLFTQINVKSSNTNIATVNVTGTPASSNFQFQSARKAQFNQLLSSRFDNTTTPLGAGTVKLGFGGFANDGVDLDNLNGGDGVQRGKIKITDRSGASQVVDLRYVKTIDDVIEAINSAADISVTASVDGDRIKLTDNTGSTSSNLVVQQYGVGSTAQDLGLSSINVAANSATGSDIYYLSESTRLSTLNDGNGVDFHNSLADLQVTFRDNSAAVSLDFDDEATIGDVIDTINAAAPTKLRAQISSDGSRLELVDLTTSSGGTFAVTALNGSNAPQDLGLDKSAVADTLSGRRLQGGLGSALITSLGGGDGFGTLGVVAVTNKNGTSANVDLGSAETLEDIIDAFNSAGISVEATLNSAKNGIVLTDTSGGSGNLVIANGGDSLTTADKLGITYSGTATSKDSGNLNLQTINANTSLSKLNNGKGVAERSFTITDTNGAIGAVNLATEGLDTVGDVLEAVNALGIGVKARINDSGDGILLYDTAGGTGDIVVAESGSGTAAKDLGLLGTSSTVSINGTPTKVIDGSQSFDIELDSDDTLEDLITKINDADAGVSASKFFDGTGYRLSITSEVSGKGGRIRFDASALNLQFDEITKGQDALVVIGSPDSIGAGVLASSSTNTFENLVDGVSFTLVSTSTELVTISGEETNAKLKTNLKLFVDQYNKLFEKLADNRKFENTGSDTDPNIKTGLLFGSSELLKIEQSLGNLVSGSIRGAGTITSLSELGFDVDENGELSFDEEKFDDVYAAKAEQIKEFFSDEEFGVAKKFHDAIELLAGVGDSILLNRNKTLQAKIDFNTERIDSLNISLDKQRTRLLTRFYLLESQIQSLKDTQSKLGAIQPLPAYTGA